MKVEELVAHHPYLYHMAETGTWESIQRHGLLSTIALLDLFEISGVERKRIESERRPESVTISHPKHGRAVIRDQKPMSEKALLKCLQDGISPSKWYEILNGQVFFWLNEKRLDRLLCARAYRHKQHCVITLDTAKLVEISHANITLSPINSGSTIYTPQPRGKSTFLPITDYPFTKWKAKRPSREAIVELVVKYGVPKVENVVVRVQERKASKVVKTLLNRL